MQKIEQFKDFVRQNMYLKTAVDRRMITWQKAYELYDLFGESASDFEDIRIKVETQQATTTTTSTTTSTASSSSTYDILNILSTIDYNKVGNTIDQLQRILGVVKDFTKQEDNPDPAKSRRVFKRFND